jgi:hypothetical protein
MRRPRGRPNSRYALIVANFTIVGDPDTGEK